MNPLNVFNNPYYKWKYPDCWLKNIRMFFRSIKYAYQRITKGFAYCDTWDLDDYYTHLFVDSLKMYSEHMNGWPQSKEFPEFEDYKKYIDRMVYLFDQSIEGHEDIKNKYAEEYEAKILNKPDFLENINKEKTPEEKALLNKYFKREEELCHYRKACRNEALDMMKHIYDSLWW